MAIIFNFTLLHVPMRKEDRRIIPYISSDPCGVSAEDGDGFRDDLYLLARAESAEMDLEETQMSWCIYNLLHQPRILKYIHLHVYIVIMHNLQVSC